MTSRWEARVARRTDVAWVRIACWVVGASFALTGVGFLLLFALGV